MCEVDNIKLLNLSYEQTPDIFAKRCIKCCKLIYIEKSSIDDIITCPNCKSNIILKINIPKSIKLKLVDD